MQDDQGSTPSEHGSLPAPHLAGAHEASSVTVVTGSRGTHHCVGRPTASRVTLKMEEQSGDFLLQWLKAQCLLVGSKGLLPFGLISTHQLGP